MFLAGISHKIPSLIRQDFVLTRSVGMTLRFVILGWQVTDGHGSFSQVTNSANLHFISSSGGQVLRGFDISTQFVTSAYHDPLYVTSRLRFWAYFDCSLGANVELYGIELLPNK
jgi:hypothetical protein